MRHAIILAGGVGSRFWPLSKPHEPKQFLKIYSKKSMLQETIQRIRPLIAKDRLHLACGRSYNKSTKKRIGTFGILPENIFLEPQTRNTLAPIAYLSWLIWESDPQAVIVVLPSDHFIRDKSKFLKRLEAAMRLAEGGRILTFGVAPTRPETGYGYIKVKGQRPKVAGKAYEVERFTEKPGLAKAKVFLQDKRYYWNSGIFVFRAETMLSELKVLAPDAYRTIAKVFAGGNINRSWIDLPATSIDYAVMEKTKKILLMPLDCGWVDLGSWQAIGEILKPDGQGNIFKGDCIDAGSSNTIVWSQGGPVRLATVGLKDIVIVKTNDAVLVCARDKAQDVREIAQRI